MNKINSFLWEIATYIYLPLTKYFTLTNNLHILRILVFVWDTTDRSKDSVMKEENEIYSSKLKRWSGSLREESALNLVLRRVKHQVLLQQRAPPRSLSGLATIPPSWVPPWLHFWNDQICPIFSSRACLGSWGMQRPVMWHPCPSSQPSLCPGPGPQARLPLSNGYLFPCESLHRLSLGPKSREVSQLPTGCPSWVTSPQSTCHMCGPSSFV